MEAGALLYGKVLKPGLEAGETRGRQGQSSRRGEEIQLQISE
jgi:hypothetical protein